MPKFFSNFVKFLNTPILGKKQQETEAERRVREAEEALRKEEKKLAFHNEEMVRLQEEGKRYHEAKLAELDRRQAEEALRKEEKKLAELEAEKKRPTAKAIKLDTYLDKIHKTHIDEHLITELYSNIRKSKSLSYEEITKLRSNYKDFFRKLFKIISVSPTEDICDKNIFILKTFGIDDELAIAAVINHIVGWGTDSKILSTLRFFKDKTTENDIGNLHKEFYRATHTDESTINPPIYNKKQAMDILLKLTEDTRALAAIGYRCMKHYEDISGVRIHGINALKDYANSLTDNFRAQNPTIIFFILKNAQDSKKEPDKSVRSIAIEAMSSIAKHICHKVMKNFKELFNNEPDEKNRSKIRSQMDSISSICPDDIATLMDSICLGLFDEEYGNRKKNISNLFLVKNWELVIEYLKEEKIVMIFSEAARFIEEEKTEVLKNQFLENIQDEKFIFFKLLRDDSKDDFLDIYEKTIKNNKNTSTEKLITGFRTGLTLLLNALGKEIVKPDGFYSNSINAVKAIKEVANRNDSKVRKQLIAIFRHFELQGQTFYDESFEKAINPAGFLDLPCEGGNCVLRENNVEDGRSFNDNIHSKIDEHTASNERKVIPKYSAYNAKYTYYEQGNYSGSNYFHYNTIRSYRYKYTYVTLSENCHFNLDNEYHIVGNFYSSSCFTSRRSHYTKTTETFSIRNKPAMFDSQLFNSFLTKMNSRPLLTTNALSHIYTIASRQNWADYIPFYNQLSDLHNVTFKKVYQKEPTENDIDSLLPQLNPAREFIMELLDTMQVLCIKDDVATQEYLIGLLEAVHWHEDTRIKIVETLAEITRNEALPTYDYRATSHRLSITANSVRESSSRVKDAIKKAIEKITNRPHVTGGEMVLADGQDDVEYL